MSFDFQGFYLTPGMHDERFTTEATLLWGRWDQAEYVQAILDENTVDTGNDDNTSLRKGLALGINTTTKLFTHWDPYATDGSEYLAGFLFDAIDLSWITGSTKKRVHAIVVKGNIKEDQVIIPGESDRGLVGTDYEFLLREQARGRFLFDDDIDRKVNWKVREHAFTAGDDSITVTTDANKTHFTNRGGDAAGTIILPDPVPGLRFKVTPIEDFNITLDTAATGTFITAGGTGDTEVIDEDDKQTAFVEAIRIGASAYAYKVVGASELPAEA